MSEQIPEQFQDEWQRINDELFFVSLELQDVTQRYYELIAARIAIVGVIRGEEMI